MTNRRFRVPAALLAATAIMGIFAAVAMTATIVGDNGDNVLTGTPGHDRIFAKGGNDVVDALAGNDRVNAGAGNAVERRAESEHPQGGQLARVGTTSRWRRRSAATTA